MQKFNSAGVAIAYDDVGRGEPVLLIHGYASNGRVNWDDTGWVRFLTEEGFRVITIDNRGHGESEKLYDPARYAASEMAEDAARLLTHLQLPSAHVMGYSMGARIAAFLTLNHARLVRDAVFAGLAANMIHGVPGAEAIAAAMEAQSLAAIPTAAARAFRVFAEQTKSDRQAMAACIRSSRARISAQMLAAIQAPVLVVAGSEDHVAGPLEPLVSAIPGSKAVLLPGRNHMNAVGDKTAKAEVAAFFKMHPTS